MEGERSVWWWAAIWGCGDTAGNSVQNKGILEASRRWGHIGGTFQKREQFKGLPYFFIWFAAL
jgi:hypothetical protein